MGLLWKAYKLHAEKEKRVDDHTERLEEWFTKFVDTNPTNKIGKQKSLNKELLDV